MVAWLLLVVVSAAAQEPIPSRTPIVTDNPTISRSSHAVGRGVVVLEANYAYASTKDGNPPVTSLPFILHVGVTDDLELRAESNGPLWQAEKRGFADLALGFRYEFVPDWAIVGLVTIPTGTPGFRAAYATPFVSINHDQPLSDVDALLFNVGATFVPHGTTQAFGTMVYSRTVTENVSWFLEGAVVGNDTRVDTGLQIFLDEDFVINLAVLRGLGNGQDWGGTAGFGARF